MKPRRNGNGLFGSQTAGLSLQEREEFRERICHALFCDGRFSYDEDAELDDLIAFASEKHVHIPPLQVMSSSVSETDPRNERTESQTNLRESLGVIPTSQSFSPCPGATDLLVSSSSRDVSVFREIGNRLELLFFLTIFVVLCAFIVHILLQTVTYDSSEEILFPSNFCDSYPIAANARLENCVPCPNHGNCYDGILSCDESYELSPSRRECVDASLSFYIPLAHYLSSLRGNLECATSILRRIRLPLFLKSENRVALTSAEQHEVVFNRENLSILARRVIPNLDISDFQRVLREDDIGFLNLRRIICPGDASSTCYEILPSSATRSLSCIVLNAFADLLPLLLFGIVVYFWIVIILRRRYSRIIISKIFARISSHLQENVHRELNPDEFRALSESIYEEIRQDEISSGNKTIPSFSALWSLISAQDLDLRALGIARRYRISHGLVMTAISPRKSH